MSLDKHKSIRSKIIHFLFLNLFWYLIFGVIYWNFDCSDWELTQTIWGKLVLIFLEISFLYSVNETKEDESE